MIIRRLSIQDFGIFRDQVMEDIASGIVLVAGPNRAGKTTLMQLLRYLGYRFPRSKVLPYYTNEYNLQADIIGSDGNRYILSRTGYGDPQLTGSNGLGLNEIYHIDDFTYRQLFTISLDELRRIPVGVESKEIRNLQSVLLGAGMLDLMMIPSILAQFEKQADSIGGKHGNFGVREFSPFHDQIKEAVEQRNQAHQEIAEYSNKQEQLEEIRSQLNAKSEQLKIEDRTLQQLRFLSDRYEQFNEYRELSIELDNPENQEILDAEFGENLEKAQNLAHQYAEIQEKYEQYLDGFRRIISEADWQTQKERLLANKTKINEWTRRGSGLEERLKKYISSKDETMQQNSKLRQRLQSINEEWSGDFSVLDHIRTDQINRAALWETVAEYEKLEDRYERHQEELDRLERGLTGHRDTFDALEPPSSGLKPWILVSGTALSAIIGILLVLVLNTPAGLIVGIAGVLFFSTFAVVSHMQSREARQYYQQKEDELRRKKMEVQQFRSELDELGNQVEAVKAELNQFREKLNLSWEQSLISLKEYFRDVDALKQDYADWRRRESNLEDDLASLEKEVQQLREVIDSVVEITATFDSLEQEAGYYISRLNDIVEWLERAEELQHIQEEKQEIEARIQRLVFPEKEQGDLFESAENLDVLLRQYIRDGERQRTLENRRQEKDNLVSIFTGTFAGKTVRAFIGEMHEELPAQEILEILENNFEEYVSGESIREALTRKEKTVRELKSEIDGLKQQIAKLEQQLEMLATSDRLDEAQRQFDKARNQLEPLAREYAINRIAGFALGKLRDRLVQQTRDELLSDASVIFREITSGEYQQITLPDDLGSLDFLAVADDNKPAQSTEILSRGTQEQLFLAVRMSRIQHVEPPLPVILDDSLVNFDAKHRREAAKMIGTLAKHNQIFVLTCHPEIVRYIEETDSNIQYWTIQGGKIERSNRDSVYSLLTGELDKHSQDM